MKKMTRTLSIAVVAVMTFCLCSFGLVVNVGAVGENTITITNSNSAVSIDGNTYTAYKVFAASVAGSEETSAHTYTLDANCLNGITGYESLNAAYTPSGITETNVRAFANDLYNAYIKDKTVPASVHQATGTASGESATINITNPGYYIVVGQAKSNDGENTVVTSLAMLDTASDKKGASIQVKADAPTITDEGKKAKDSDTGATYKNVNDSQIGEEIEYKINVTIPRVNGYSTYTYKIKDQLSAGLKYVEGSVALKTTGGTAIASTYWTPTIDNTARTMEVSVDVLEGLANSAFSEEQELVLTYKAKVVGADAKYATTNGDDANFNCNSVKIEYSNNPYDDTSKDETPTFKSYDYTYGIEVDKVKQDSSALAGAKFEIYNGAVSETNKMRFVNTAASGTPVYKVYVEGDTGTAVTELVADSDGKLKVYGFDSDTLYNLKETVAPDGYKKIEDAIPFQIDATLAEIGGDSADMITSLAFNAANKASGITYLDATASAGLMIKVPNTAGQKLVSTGGIGTTIFYVCGGILMAGAVVLLIAKLRMKNK